MWNKLLLVPCALSLILLFTACSDDDDGDNAGSIPSTANTAVAGVSGAVDTEAILGNVEDVRAMIERNAPDLDPNIVDDVDFSDGALTVTLADSQDGLDTSGLQDACNKIKDAIALPDLSVTVEKANGSDTVECEG